jgi:hypothetical protein
MFKDIECQNEIEPLVFERQVSKVFMSYVFEFESLEPFQMILPGFFDTPKNSLPWI